MKNSIKWLAILSMLLIVLMTGSLIACNKDNGDVNTNTDTSTDTATDTDTNVPEPPVEPDAEPEIYTVTFRQGNGVPDIVMQIERGTIPTLPEIQPEIGYDLEWEVTDFTNLCNDGLVGVHRTPIPFNITYVVGEGTNSKDNPNTVTIVDTVKLQNPERVGCIFNGWYSDEACTNKITEIAKGTNKDLSIYASWTPVEYSLSYDVVGGTNDSKNPTKYTVDSEITLAAPTKEDYDFVGWYIKGTDTKVESTEDIVGDVELQAKWIIERFEITYVGVTEDEHNNPADFDKTEGFTFEPASRYGYTFGGWFADEDFTTPITSISVGTKENKTVYAKLTINTYSIEYELGTGMTNSSNNILNYNVNTEFEFIAPTFTEGYTFDGWYIKGTDTKVEAIVQGGTLQQNIVLEAKFSFTKYAIEYNINGGIMPEGTLNYYTVENTGSNAFVLPIPTKEGYKFSGWYSDEDFESLKLSTLDGSKKENVTLYAKWAVANYNIEYNYGMAGNLGVTNDNPAAYNMNKNVNFVKASKEGFIFIGWYSDPEFNNVIKTTEGLYEDITVYAKWIEGANIADQAQLTTTGTAWVCNQDTMKYLVDGNHNTGIGEEWNTGKYTLTFDYSNEHYVTSVVLVCNSTGSIVGKGEITETTTYSYAINLTAYDSEGNVVFGPTEKNPNGKETVEFEINAEIAKIEIVVNTGYGPANYLWEVEINAGA